MTTSTSKTQWRQLASDIAAQFAVGASDASAWPKALIVLYSSRKLQMLYFKCLVLNGVVLIGSIVFFRYVILSLVHLMFSRVFIAIARSVVGEYTMPADVSHAPPVQQDSATLSSWERYAEVVLSVLYYVLWVYPVYALTFILNSMWYQDIADLTYVLHSSKSSGTQGVQAASKVAARKQKTSFVQTVVEEVYRALLFLAFLAIASVLYMVPLPAPLNSLGALFSFTHVAWLYGYYSFEYKWIIRGWSLEQRMRYVEENWAYFAGFGFPCTMMTFFFSTVVAGGIFAIMFPMFIIMANSSSSRAHITAATSHTGNAQATAANDDDDDPVSARPTSRMPIFNAAKRITDFVISRVPLLRKVGAPAAPAKKVE
ncbi:hypothetical protein RI367_002525 [Sorochytrium milnesiophthora]